MRVSNHRRSLSIANTLPHCTRVSYKGFSRNVLWTSAPPNRARLDPPRLHPIYRRSWTSTSSRCLDHRLRLWSGMGTRPASLIAAPPVAQAKTRKVQPHGVRRLVKDCQRDRHRRHPVCLPAPTCSSSGTVMSTTSPRRAPANSQAGNYVLSTIISSPTPACTLMENTLFEVSGM